MTTPATAQLKSWTTALSPAPLDVAQTLETRYVPLHHAARGAVDELMATIELAFDSTTQLLSGPAGSGKTTELLRLRRDMRARGYDVLVVDMKRYISMSTPIDITEVLIGIAIGAYEAAGSPETSGSFGRRFLDMLSRLSVDLEFAGVSAGMSKDQVSLGTPGAAIELSLGSEIKSSEKFVHDLRQRLAYHVGTLHTEVSRFLRELVQRGPESTGAVLIIDGLEQLQGTTDNADSVQDSVQSLFVGQASKLRFTSHHVVYTVPAYLQFTFPGALPYESRVLSVAVPYVSGASAAALQNVEQFREVLRRRVPVEEFFGVERDALDRLIQASGGHLRDLFRLVRQLISIVSRRGLTLPVDGAAVDEAISDIARDFSHMTEESAAFLTEVAGSAGTFRPTAAQVPLMARLVQGHMILSHLNGHDWYEVHPLARRALDLP